MKTAKLVFAVFFVFTQIALYLHKNLPTMRFSLIILLSFQFLGCKPELENKADASLYFDVKDLVNKQVERLKDTHKRVQKFIRHDKQRENNMLEVTNWHQELKIFEEANLNRPIYKDLYLKKDSAVQDMQYVIYVAKSENLQVRQMRLGYQQKVLRTLEADLWIRNILYSSEKRLRLSFAPDNLLNGYSIKGNFNLVYGVKHDYEIDAVVKDKQ